MKKAKITNETKRNVMKIYRRMLKCVHPDHIEDAKFICKKLKEIEVLKIAIPDELSKRVSNFIERTIQPVLKPGYLDMELPEGAHIGEDGITYIDTEEALIKILAEFYMRCIELENKIHKFAKTEMHPYLI